jgi:DNA-binding MarR family transcriptional regulator
MPRDLQTPRDTINPSRTLTRIARLTTRHFDRMLAGSGLSVAYLGILGPLFQGPPLPQKELMASIAGSQAATAELLARMVKEGLLDRQQDPSDRRQVLFSLTSAGAKLMPEINRVIREGNDEVFSIFEPSELETLVSLLSRLEAKLFELQGAVPTR